MKGLDMVTKLVVDIEKNRSIPYEIRMECYKRGEYACAIPAVTTQYWTDDSWVRFITVHGAFFVKNLERTNTDGI